MQVIVQLIDVGIASDFEGCRLDILKTLGVFQIFADN
jgi:hypothetical protein